MFLRSLQLTNFRNFKSARLNFNSNISVFWGSNAEGKTNLLESIFFLATTKSFKGHIDSQLINKNTQSASVSATIDDGTSLDIAMLKTEDLLKKVTKVNGIGRRITDYIGNFLAVAFTPEDINLVTGPPSLRRWHLDLTLAQVDRLYKYTLTSYGEILIRRNKLLKLIREGKARESELVYWSDKLLELGTLIQKKRRDFFDAINTVPQFEYQYLENSINQDKLSSLKQKEILTATSLCGPHRDDFLFLAKSSSNSADLAIFGSRGEQRSAVFFLKLQEVTFFENITNKRPILLLDDIFSELDKNHKDAVLQLIPLQQTIISTIELDEKLKSLEGAEFIFVRNGQLFEKPEGLQQPQSK